MLTEPTIRTEREEILAYITEQTQALRAAASGLTEDQARETPTASALSIGGLLKHVTFVFSGPAQRAANPTGAMTQEEYERLLPMFENGFRLLESESFAATLEAYDAAAERYLSAIAQMDPDEEVLEPAAPWFGRMEAVPIRARFYLLHQIEELARHAGHADIIREQLDGKTTFELMGVA
ncbi:DUF664 domain-containing protein [Demetria terragena]|uniref:mycothiol transferase n=1 Tax=Demetria terragena TaxID=63959 RepID=UPI0003675A7C|nr:DUF664 domain-containing protein [Demetria terragena]